MPIPWEKSWPLACPPATAYRYVQVDAGLFCMPKCRRRADVGPSLAAAKMLAHRRLLTTCRRQHAAAEMPTAPRLLPTSNRLWCRDANVGPMSDQRRHAAAEMPKAPRLLPTSSRFKCLIAEVRPTSGRRRHAAAKMPTSSQCLPTSGRLRHAYLVPVQWKRKR